MKKKFKEGDLVHLNPKSKWNYGNTSNPIRTLGEVIDTNGTGSFIGLPIRVEWVNEKINSYENKDLLLATESIILKYLNKSLKDELKKLGIKS